MLKFRFGFGEIPCTHKVPFLMLDCCINRQISSSCLVKNLKTLFVYNNNKKHSKEFLNNK